MLAVCVALCVCESFVHILIFIQFVESVTQVLNGGVFCKIILRITAAENHTFAAGLCTKDCTTVYRMFPLDKQLFVSFILFNSSFVQYGFFSTRAP